MGSDDELINEIWVSNNFTSIAFSKNGVRTMVAVVSLHGPSLLRPAPFLQGN